MAIDQNQYWNITRGKDASEVMMIAGAPDVAIARNTQDVIAEMKDGENYVAISRADGNLERENRIRKNLRRQG